MVYTRLYGIQSQIYDWSDIYTKEVIVVDDIEDILFFLRSSLCDSLLRTPAKNLILITRDNSKDSSYPSIIIGSLRDSDAFLMTDLMLKGRISGYDRVALVEQSKGNPLFLQILIKIYTEYSIPINEIVYQWSLPENAEFLDLITQKPFVLPILNEEELVLLQILIILGDIDLDLFLRWSEIERSEVIVHNLVNKGIVYVLNNRILRTKVKYIDPMTYKSLQKLKYSTFSDMVYKACIGTADNILCDMKHGLAVDDKYPERIMGFIREKDSGVAFVIDYYHLKYKVNDNNVVNSILREIAKDIKEIKYTSVETNATVKYIDQKTDDFYGFLCSILGQLQDMCPNDTEVLEKLEELRGYALHPQKGVGEKAYAAIGFLGSIASIAASPQGASLLNQLTEAFNSIVVMQL